MQFAYVPGATQLRMSKISVQINATETLRGVVEKLPHEGLVYVKLARERLAGVVREARKAVLGVICSYIIRSVHW